MKLTFTTLALLVSSLLVQSFPTDQTSHYLGCFADKKSARAFPLTMDMVGRGDPSRYMQLCHNLALGSNSKFYAMEAGRFCFYGGVAYNKYGSSKGCNQACGMLDSTTDAKPSCGGQLALDVYVLGHR